MQLGRDKRRDGGAVPEPDAGDISAENVVPPMVNVMVTGMAWRCDRPDFERGDRDDLIVFENSDAFCRDGCDVTPQPLHVLPKDARCGCDQLGGIGEVLGAAGMDVNGGAKLGETPGRPRVIKMNMTEEDMLNVVSGRPNIFKRSDNVVEGRFRPGIEKGEAVVSFERGCGDNAWPPELNGVEDVNFQRRVVIGYQLAAISYQLSGSR